MFNLTPSPGEPVRFGFFVIGIAVTIDFHIRTGEDYGATATVSRRHPDHELHRGVADDLGRPGRPGPRTPARLGLPGRDSTAPPARRATQ